MILLDSNVVIDAIKPRSPLLLEWLTALEAGVSAISRVEVLGYHKLIEGDRRDLEAYLGSVAVIPISSAVIERAIVVRQARKMSLGDALIAATALVHGLGLATRNVKDFERVEGLTLIALPA